MSKNEIDTNSQDFHAGHRNGLGVGLDMVLGWTEKFKNVTVEELSGMIKAALAVCDSIL